MGSAAWVLTSVSTPATREVTDLVLVDHVLSPGIDRGHLGAVGRGERGNGLRAGLEAQQCHVEHQRLIPLQDLCVGVGAQNNLAGVVCL